MITGGTGDWFSQYLAGLANPKPANPLIDQTNTTGNPQYAMWNATGTPYPQAAPSANSSAQTPDFLHQLFQQLLGNASSAYKMPSPQEILQQATSQVASQYDPRINSIQRQIGTTTARANTNKAELKNLYGGVANSYNGDMATAKKTGAASVADEKARQKTLQNNLKQDYSSSLNDQVKQFADLGISQATPQATQQQRQDLNYLQQLDNTTGNANLSSLNAQNTGDQQYYNESKGIARLQGAGAVSDLMSQLNDYVTQQQGSISDLQAQRQAAISQLQQQLTSQATNAQNTAQQSSWNNLFKLAGLYQSMNKAAPMAHNGLNAASQYLAQATTPQKASDTMGMLQQLLASPEFTSGQQTVNGKQIKSTPEQLASVGGKYVQGQGWSPADETALMQAILAYYGRLGG